MISFYFQVLSVGSEIVIELLLFSVVSCTQVGQLIQWEFVESGSSIASNGFALPVTYYVKFNYNWSRPI